MLAVLPFDNLSDDPEDAYFGEGLTEEMITTLGRLKPERLGVIARSSVDPFRTHPRSVPRIGAELGVDYLLKGSVRRQKNRIRVSAQLIGVTDQTQLWWQDQASMMKTPSSHFNTSVHTATLARAGGTLNGLGVVRDGTFIPG